MSMDAPGVEELAQHMAKDEGLLWEELTPQLQERYRGYARMRIEKA
jgi:hypothetical protein